MKNKMKSSFIKYCVFFTLYFSFLAIDAQIFTVAFSVLCCYALTGKEQAIKALSIVAISKSLNPAIYAFSPETGILAWLVFFLASSRIILFSWNNFIRTVPLYVYSVVILMLSIFASVNPEISLMKLITFTIGAAAVILGYSSLDEEQSERMKAWFFSIYFVIILLSLPTFVFPNIAYNRNGQGFQGILNHPQSFGPMLAPIATWLLAGVLFEKSKKQLLAVIVCVMLITLMVLSQARTSLTAVFVSLFFFFFMLQIKKKSFKNAYSGRAILVGIALVLSSVIAFSSSTVIQDKLTGFVFKRDSTDIDEALSSRSGGIVSQWHFFLKSPVLGNGFCVYPWGELPMGVTYYNGIPISAPVEKGFLPTAILEETGLIGAIFFIYFLYQLFKICLKNANLKYVCMFLSCIAINVGEVFIFSMGGIGLFYWLLIGLSILPSKQK